MNPMMRVSFAGLFATLLFCSTYSAPVVSKAKKEAKKTEVEKKSIPASSAEQELERLAASQKDIDTTIPAEQSLSETPEFIKQAIQKAKASEEFGQNIPAPVEDSIDNTEQLQQLLNEVRSNFDVSPRTVAKYLLIDGDFEGFNKALDELTHGGILSPSEVARFREEVSRHYDNLLTNLVESQDVLPEDSAYVPYEEYPEDNGLEYDSYRPSARQEYNSYRPSALDDSYRPSALEEYDQALARMQLQNYMEKQASLDSLLRQLITDYYSRYGVDETYENYYPSENANFDDSLANEYDMMPAEGATPEQQAEEAALEQEAEQSMAAPEPVKKSKKKKVPTATLR